MGEAVKKLSAGIREFIKSLDDYPGWREWQRDKIRHVLFFDDYEEGEVAPIAPEFTFTDEIEKRHAVVFQFVQLQDSINSVRDCEYYFRRYPFTGTPVTRQNHLTNVCEMFFSRFYEFEERLARYLNAVEAAAPGHKIDIGKFIKVYKKTFETELRARHSVNHTERFSEIEISRLYIAGITLEDRPDRAALVKSEYRRVCGVWVKRVRRRADHLEKFLEAVAQATLDLCPFLRVPTDTDANVSSNQSG